MNPIRFGPLSYRHIVFLSVHLLSVDVGFWRARYSGEPQRPAGAGIFLSLLGWFDQGILIVKKSLMRFVGVC